MHMTTSTIPTRRILLASLLALLIAACGGESEAVVSGKPVEQASATESEAVTTTTEAVTTTTQAPPTTELATTTTSETTTTAEASTTSPPATSPLYVVDAYDPERDAFSDLENAIAAAAADGKHVIAIVGGDWCPDCLNFDTFLKDRPDLFDAMHSEFVIAKITLDADNENVEFLAQYPQFEWVPHFFIFDGTGSLVESYDTRGLMENGLFDEAAFDQFLGRYV